MESEAVVVAAGVSPFFAARVFLRGAPEFCMRVAEHERRINDEDDGLDDDELLLLLLLLLFGVGADADDSHTTTSWR